MATLHPYLRCRICSPKLSLLSESERNFGSSEVFHEKDTLCSTCFQTNCDLDWLEYRTTTCFEEQSDKVLKHVIKIVFEAEDRSHDTLPKCKLYKLFLQNPLSITCEQFKALVNNNLLCRKYEIPESVAHILDVYFNIEFEFSSFTIQ